MDINEISFVSLRGWAVSPTPQISASVKEFCLFCAWFQLELQAETGKYSEILLETGISDLIVKVTNRNP